MSLAFPVSILTGAFGPNPRRSCVRSCWIQQGLWVLGTSLGLTLNAERNCPMGSREALPEEIRMGMGKQEPRSCRQGTNLLKTLNCICAV